MIYKLKFFIRTTPIIYKVAKRFTKGKQSVIENICRKNSDLCIEGYPCSANSFTYVLLRHLNKHLEIAHHTHAIANLKLSLKYKIPTVILIRNPEDAISSRVARFGGNLVERVQEYIDFYKFVRKHVDKLLILPFEEVTQNTEKCLNWMSKTTGINFYYDDINNVIQDVLDFIENWTRKYGKLSQISLPSQDREIQKTEIKKNLRKLIPFKKAVYIWKDILKTLPDISS